MFFHTACPGVCDYRYFTTNSPCSSNNPTPSCICNSAYTGSLCDVPLFVPGNLQVNFMPGGDQDMVELMVCIYVCMRQYCGYNSSPLCTSAAHVASNWASDCFYVDSKRWDENDMGKVCFKQTYVQLIITNQMQVWAKGYE